MGELGGRSEGSASRGGFLTGFLVGALLAVLAWGLASAVDSTGPTPVDRGVAAPAHEPSSTSSADPQAACRRVYEAQERSLRAADASLEQWKVHVGAMNKLVAGEITLSQATAFWDRTRIGAKRRLASYDAAARSLARVDVTCPRTGPGASRAHRSCAAAVGARTDELRAASVALRTWRRHVRDMDMLRMGRMSPSQATQMWLRNWQKGVEQLDDYGDASRAATRAAARSHCA